MHIPDGFIDAGTSLAAGALAGGGLTVATRRAADELDDRRIPVAGLTAAFVFAVQMLNFPIAAGTSGHLIGGVLAAVLVGPWAGAVAVGVVVLVQALFADGGISALGLNIVNLSFVATLGGYGAFAFLMTFLPRRAASIPVAAGVAAGLSVVMAAGAFAVEYSVGGQGAASATTVAWAMVGVHSLIALVEGVLTSFTVAAVLGIRPDLVHGSTYAPPAVPERAIARSTA